jgi:S-layer glycoprotein
VTEKYLTPDPDDTQGHMYREDDDSTGDDTQGHRFHREAGDDSTGDDSTGDDSTGDDTQGHVRHG